MFLQMPQKDKVRMRLADAISTLFDDDKLAEFLQKKGAALGIELGYCDCKGECGEGDCDSKYELNCIKRWLNEETIVEIKEDNHDYINS